MIDRDDPVNTVDVLLAESSSEAVALTRRAFETGRRETTLHVVSDGADCLRFLRRRDEYADAPQPGLAILRIDPFESPTTDPDEDSDTDVGAKTNRDSDPNADDEPLLETLAADPTLCRIPTVVCLPAGASRETVRRCYDHRANAVVVMPDDDESFVDYMQQIQRFWVRAARLPPARLSR